MHCSSRATACQGKVPILWQAPGRRGSLGQGTTQLALLAELALALNVQELLLKEALLDSTHQELLLKDSEALLVLRFLVSLAFLFTCLPQVEIGIVQAREKMLPYHEVSKEKKQI